MSNEFLKRQMYGFNLNREISLKHELKVYGNTSDNTKKVFLRRHVNLEDDTKLKSCGSSYITQISPDLSFNEFTVFNVTITANRNTENVHDVNSSKSNIYAGTKVGHKALF